jgi:serine/threonine protein kinase
MFTMIVNRVPYDGLKDQEILDKIKKYSVTFTGSEFHTKSTQCLQIMKRMLVKEPALRCEAKSTLIHPYFVLHNLEDLDFTFAKQALENFRKYVFYGPLKKAAVEYLVTQGLSAPEIYPYHRMFF